MHTAERIPAWRNRAVIDLEALRHNVGVAQSFLSGDERGIIAVVKANGYGHGALRVAEEIEPLVYGFAVANVREAQDLRSGGVQAPVYLLGPALREELASVVEGGYCAAVSTGREVAELGRCAAEAGRPVPVHAVIDTGMGRIGAFPEEAGRLVQAICAHPWLTLDSVASHFPSADEEPEFSRIQEERFRAIVADLRASGLNIPRIHMANSSGLTGYPRMPGDLARGGILLYGVSPLPEFEERLRPVLTWEARIVLVRRLPADHPVSYGRTWRTPRAMRVATIAAGYADGYPRQLSGKGACVLIRGVRCPVLGRVTMDQIMADVDHLPEDLDAGEKAVLVGPSGQDCISATALAAWSDTIAWDILTGLGERVERVYCRGSGTDDPDAKP